jgi:hypothetical protein
MKFLTKRILKIGVAEPSAQEPSKQIKNVDGCLNAMWLRLQRRLRLRTLRSTRTILYALQNQKKTILKLILTCFPCIPFRSEADFKIRSQKSIPVVRFRNNVKNIHTMRT